jgi:hypothetical protein
MEHEASVAQMTEGGDFDAPYENNVENWPLGKEALLPANIQFHVHAKAPFRLEFLLLGEKSFEVAMGRRLLHGFCKLFQDAVEKADWGFSLEMPGASNESAPAGLLN